ncbi:unnamed protein product [Mytilus coruscus]|uniref:SLC22A4_5 n=1 Tax=Mytilus coruscus TaxID=42192 RepID=A0A6J8EHQ6_MYTCO|nr:unnamed protein product [Mytilus coruscus]
MEQVSKENRGIVSALGSLTWALHVIGVAGIGYLMRNIHWRYVQMASGLVGVHSLFIGKYGITLSFSNIYLGAPELFPRNLRNTGLGIGTLFARVGGMFAPYSSLLAKHIEWGPGVIFGACCGVVTLLHRLLPETSGKDLPQTVDELIEWDRKKETTK